MATRGRAEGVGLPPVAQMWAEQLPVMRRSTIEASAKHGTMLVFFDNTYMYPMTRKPQTEETPFAPVGRKAVTRAQIATMLLAATLWCERRPSD